MMKYPHKSSPRGFTLLELVLVIVVLGLTALPLSLLLTEYTEGAALSHDKSLACQLGRMEMEKVRNLGYGEVQSGDFPGYEGYDYDVSRTVTFIFGDAGSPESLKMVLVNVRKSGQPSILSRLVTYRARNVLYGG